VDIPKAILKKLDIHPVSTIDQVLELALIEMPKPLPSSVEVKKSDQPKGSETVITH
jgi:predicted ATP-dependent protease